MRTSQAAPGCQRLILSQNRVPPIWYVSFNAWLDRIRERDRILLEGESIYHLEHTVGKGKRELSLFLIGSYGNYLINPTPAWQKYTDMFIAKGGVAGVFPLHASRDQELERKLFEKFGGAFYVPDPTEWPHVLSKPVCFLPGLKTKRLVNAGAYIDGEFEFDGYRITADQGVLATDRL